MKSGDYGREADRFRGANGGRRQFGNEPRDGADFDQEHFYRDGEREGSRNWGQERSRNRRDMPDYGNRREARGEYQDDADEMYPDMHDYSRQGDGRDYARTSQRQGGYDADREGFPRQSRQQEYGQSRQQEYQDRRDSGGQRWGGRSGGANPGGMGDTYDRPRYRDSSGGWMSQGDGSDESAQQYGQRPGSQSGNANQMSRGGRGGMQSEHVGKGPKGWKRSDERIREEVSEALARHGDIDASEIEVQVRDGEVTLTGTVTDRDAKRLAEDAAECVFGVGEVQNSLRVSRGSDSEVQRGVDRGADRQADGARTTADGADKSKKGMNAGSANREVTAS